MGEHGDSAFVPWSIANISNIPLDVYAESIKRPNCDFPKFDREAVEQYVKTSGASVIKRKGATFYAVSMSVAHICKCLLSGIDTTITVSTMLHGEYGLDDICLSLLNVVGSKGAHTKVTFPLTDFELQQLRKSADTLREVINSVNI